MTPNSQTACESCPAKTGARLIRRGADAGPHDFVVALAGNPNVGKSTVFNALTGLRQHTGNWPGKTVSRAEGAFTYDAKAYRVVDLPGTYSLLSTSTDEEIARDFILFERPDVTVVVCDAAMLERNLNLALQVLGITEKAVVCVNLIDEAERHGRTVDVRSLSKDLGVPVVATAARTGRGLQELLEAIADVATGRFLCRPKRVWTESKALKASVDKLEAMILQEFPRLANARWVALRLLEGDQRIIDAVRTGALADLGSAPTTSNEKIGWRTP